MRDLPCQDESYISPEFTCKAVKNPAISVVGLGYVGAVSTACLSSLGHRVIGVDIDPRKVRSISAGKSPIHEKNLDSLLRDGVRRNLITASDDLEQAVRDTDITMVSVGTPSCKNGGCDHSFIEAAANGIGRGLKSKSSFHIVVLRCSVPPGMTMRVVAPILERVSGRKAGKDFGICFNPEFLREGVAVADFYDPTKTVIGATDKRTGDVISKIFKAVDPNPIVTSVEVAEAIKYVDNIWHATKVCFANEVGRLCKALDVDSHQVMDVFVQDKKLNLSPYYLKPGFAYGGSCLPKEVRAVNQIAKINGLELPLISSLEESNQVQIKTATEMVLKTGARRVAVLGLAFKPGTDDLRESPILEVISKLLERGIEVFAHDPVINRKTLQNGQLASVCNGPQSRSGLADRLPSMLCESAEDALEHAEAAIVTHCNDDYRTALANKENISVVDVVRLFETLPNHASYQGIAW